MSAVLDATSLSRLRWRCRRGLLENDLFVERFFAARGDAVTEPQAEGMLALMDLADNDLLDLLLRRKEPQGELCTDEVAEVLALMRTPIATRHEQDDGPTRARTPGGDKSAPFTHSLTEEKP
jgi:antitoxin CptB